MQPDTRTPWELCEIRVRTQGIFRGVTFQALAIGPAGERVVAESERFRGYGRGKKQEAAVQRLVSELVGDGWEPQGVGRSPWWGYKFRRHAQ